MLIFGHTEIKNITKENLMSVASIILLVSRIFFYYSWEVKPLGLFKNRLFCPLQCNQENPQIDTQEHLLTCTKIKIQNTNNLKIQDLFQEVDSQENIGKLLVEILQKRTRLINELETSLPGAILDQGSLLQGATAV